MSNVCFKLFMVLFVVYQRISKTDAGITCLSCKHMVQPKDCNKVVECGDHEQCYVQRYVTSSGVTWYDVGCLDNIKCAVFSNLGPPVGKRDSQVNITASSKDLHPPSVIGRRQNSGDLVICESCCNGTICNNGGVCGAAPLKNQGPVCYKCLEAEHADGCDQITQCGADQKCFIGQSRNTVSKQLRWTHGCQRSTMCNNIHVKRASSDSVTEKVCDDCCSTDLCNRNCTNYIDATLSTSQAAITTTERPTTTSDPSRFVDCNFENMLCNWHQVTTDEGDWQWHSGPTATNFTGPTGDHTLQNGKGHYLYLESSDIYYNETIRLESDNIVFPQRSCLQFWYHRRGLEYIGDLIVYIKDNNNKLNMIWRKTGNQGNVWLKADIHLPTTAGTIVIEAYRGADVYGDIAIDDIKLIPNC